MSFACVTAIFIFTPAPANRRLWQKRERSNGKSGFNIPLRIVPAKLPEILSREEVDRILWHASTFVIKCCSRSSMPVVCALEACALKVNDIDSERMMLRVTNGKGAKTAVVPKQ